MPVNNLTWPVRGDSACCTSLLAWLFILRFFYRYFLPRQIRLCLDVQAYDLGHSKKGKCADSSTSRGSNCHPFYVSSSVQGSLHRLRNAWVTRSAAQAVQKLSSHSTSVRFVLSVRAVAHSASASAQPCRLSFMACAAGVHPVMPKPHSRH